MIGEVSGVDKERKLVFFNTADRKGAPVSESTTRAADFRYRRPPNRLAPRGPFNGHRDRHGRCTAHRDTATEWCAESHGEHVLSNSLALYKPVRPMTRDSILVLNAGDRSRS